MKDVITVDRTGEATPLQGLVQRTLDDFSYELILLDPNSKNYDDDELHLKSLYEKELLQSLHSLLISKLPEKRKTDGYSRTGGVGPINYAYNQAIDDVRAVLAELFGVDNE